MEITEEKTSPSVSTNEVERKPFASETLRVRCPHCRKLYLVQMSDVRDTRPRFECVQCHSRFWLSMADVDLTTEVTGLPMQVKEVLRPQPKRVVDMQPCPKCFKAVSVRATECSHCGVMISKVKELALKDSQPLHSEALGLAWQMVIADYGNEALHQDFIQLAQRENNLPYAGIQYGQMTRLMPSDETTKRFAREVQALVASQIPSRETKAASPIFSRLWQVPLLGAAMMITIGLALPVFRNMVGVGAAILFVSIALKIQLRRRD